MPPMIYCVKCKTSTDSRDVEQIKMKNGRDAVVSFCTDCGTKKFRIGKIPATQ